MLACTAARGTCKVCVYVVVPAPAWSEKRDFRESLRGSPRRRFSLLTEKAMRKSLAPSYVWSLASERDTETQKLSEAERSIRTKRDLESSRLPLGPSRRDVCDV